MDFEYTDRMDTLMDSVNEIDLEDSPYPDRIENFVEGQIDPSLDSLPDFMQESERWDDVSRPGLRMDFWDFPDTTIEMLESYAQQEFDTPGVEGAKLAQEALELMDFGFSRIPVNYVLLAVEPDLPDDLNKVNQNLYFSPTNIDNVLPVPEEYQGDDVFTEVEGGYFATLVDDPAVLANQINYLMDHIEGEGYEFQPGFRDAFNETVEGYTGL